MPGRGHDISKAFSGTRGRVAAIRRQGDSLWRQSRNAPKRSALMSKCEWRRHRPKQSPYRVKTTRDDANAVFGGDRFCVLRTPGAPRLPSTKGPLHTAAGLSAESRCARKFRAPFTLASPWRATQIPTLEIPVALFAPSSQADRSSHDERRPDACGEREGPHVASARPKCNGRHGAGSRCRNTHAGKLSGVVNSARPAWIAPGTPGYTPSRPGRTCQRIKPSCRFVRRTRLRFHRLTAPPT